MKDSLTISPDGGHGADVDISRAMAELQAALAEGETGPQSPSKEHTDKITLSGDEDTRLLEALEAGQRAVFIDVSINEDSSWAVVRCFQVLNELSQIGELIASKPTQQEI